MKLLSKFYFLKIYFFVLIVLLMIVTHTDVLCL